MATVKSNKDKVVDIEKFIEELKSTDSIEKSNNIINKLALEIADKVIAICNEYINSENAVTGAPEIIKGNENNIKIFLKGLACKMARPDELKKETEYIKNLMDKNYYFKDLYKSKKPEAHALLNKEPKLAQPILLMQFPPRVGLFMKEIEKVLTKEYEKDNVTINGVFKEIQGFVGKPENLVEELKNKVKTWQGYVEDFKAKVNECWEQGNFPQGILTACAKEMGTDINNNYSSALGEITSIQKVLTNMMNNNNKKKVNNAEYAKSLNKNLPEKINSNIREYITNVENICNRISDPEYRSQFKETSSQEILDEVFAYLKKELKNYKLETDKPALENAEKFDEWANGIRSEFLVDEEVADRKIVACYRDMAICLSSVEDSLTVGKALEKIL